MIYTSKASEFLFRYLCRSCRQQLLQTPHQTCMTTQVGMSDHSKGYKYWFLRIQPLSSLLCLSRYNHTPCTGYTRSIRYEGKIPSGWGWYGIIGVYVASKTLGKFWSPHLFLLRPTQIGVKMYVPVKAICDFLLLLIVVGRTSPPA